MKLILLFLIVLLSNCSLKKQTFICGDRECVNSKEAQKYFQENLIIEVKVKENNKNTDSFNLVYLNTDIDEKNKSVKKENSLVRNLLSKNEKDNLKKQLKKEEKEKKRIAKLKKKQDIIKKKLEDGNNKAGFFKKKKINKPIKKITESKKSVNIKEACPVIENCDIDEIAKQLINRGKSKNYPDISLK